VTSLKAREFGRQFPFLNHGVFSSIFASLAFRDAASSVFRHRMRSSATFIKEKIDLKVLVTDLKLDQS